MYLWSVTGSGNGVPGKSEARVTRATRRGKLEEKIDPTLPQPQTNLKVSAGKYIVYVNCIWHLMWSCFQSTTTFYVSSLCQMKVMMLYAKQWLHLCDLSQVLSMESQRRQPQGLPGLLIGASKTTPYPLDLTLMRKSLLVSTVYVNYIGTSWPPRVFKDSN
jgi:hypothetical protein